MGARSNSFDEVYKMNGSVDVVEATLGMLKASKQLAETIMPPVEGKRPSPPSVGNKHRTSCAPPACVIC